MLCNHLAFSSAGLDLSGIATGIQSLTKKQRSPPQLTCATLPRSLTDPHWRINEYKLPPNQQPPVIAQ